MKRIGIFGGTFNPIHLGHIHVVREVKEGFGLNNIFLVPSSLPPHKEPGDVVNARDRIEMISLAFSNWSDFEISDVELKRPGPSYTIDTVRHFKSVLPKDITLYLILGMDAFLEIDTWMSYMDLFLLVPLIVMARTGTMDDGTVLKWKNVDDYIKSKVSDGYQFSASRSCYIHDEKQPVFVFDVTPVDISSTKIRKLVKNGSSIKFMVPETVEELIKSKGLYL